MEKKRYKKQCQTKKNRHVLTTLAVTDERVTRRRVIFCCLSPCTDCRIIIIIKMHVIYSGPTKVRATRLVNDRLWHTLYTHPPTSRPNDDRFASAIDVFLFFLSLFLVIFLFLYFLPPPNAIRPPTVTDFSKNYSSCQMQRVYIIHRIDQNLCGVYTYTVAAVNV